MGCRNLKGKVGEIKKGEGTGQSVKAQITIRGPKYREARKGFLKIVNGDNTPRKKRVPTSARSLESLQLFSLIKECVTIYILYIEIKVVYNFSLLSSMA